MKVVGANRYGGPEVLEVFELPDPVAGPGEILLRVHAAAVNPTDVMLISGARAETQASESRPLVPGMDAAGVVEAIGEGANTRLSVGDAVMAVVVPSGNHGAYSELLVLPAESVARAPQGFSLAEASTLPMNGLTARLALDVLGLKPGEVLAVTGAAGAMGGYVVQWAKADGLTVIADASEKDRELVQALGADVVLPRGDDFGERVRELYPDGADGVVDGALLLEKLVPAVKDGGGIVTLRAQKGEYERGVHFLPVVARTYAKENALLERIRSLAEEGVLTPRVAATFPFDQASEAQRRLAAGGVRGRHVIEFA